MYLFTSFLLALCVIVYRRLLEVSSGADGAEMDFILWHSFLPQRQKHLRVRQRLVVLPHDSVEFSSGFAR